MIRKSILLIKNNPKIEIFLIPSLKKGVRGIFPSGY
jgi:hypothetical protein